MSVSASIERAIITPFSKRKVEQEILGPQLGSSDAGSWGRNGVLSPMFQFADRPKYPVRSTTRFSVACEYCDTPHDYYQADLQIVSLAWVHSNTFPTRAT